MRSAPALLGAVALVSATFLAACNDDGRTLRPARPDQVASVSTLGPTTTVEPGFDMPATVLPTASTASTASTVAISSSVAPDGSADLPVVSGDSVEATLTGPWAQDAPIDPRYTCDGEDLSPALSWTPAPAGTIEIAVTMRDDDAGGFVHWAMAGLDPSTTTLGEGELPTGAIVGVNSRGEEGYAGPCPPPGVAAHHYVITVHFLAQQTELATGAAGDDLLAAVDGATFGGASLVGTYQRG